MALMMLASVVLLEAGLALLLASNLPPLCKIAKRAVDMLKSSKGTAIALTILVALLIKLAATVFHIRKVQKNQQAPPHQTHVLSSHIQEACLMGFSLFLAVVVLRLHSCLREVEGFQQQLQILRKQAETAQAEYLRAMREHTSSKQEVREEEVATVEVRSLTEIIIDLRLQLERLQLDSYRKDRKIRDAEKTVQSLHKQAEGFLLEYDRVVAENENLRMKICGMDVKPYARLHSR